MKNKPIIAWFSCGATSAVACKIGLSMYDNVRVVYVETGSSHPDNKRFLSDCEKWFGVDIEILRSDKFADVDDVLLKKRYINGPHGASCTSKLKKDVRYAYEDAIGDWGGANMGIRLLRKGNQSCYTIQATEPVNEASLSIDRKDDNKRRCTWNA